MIESLNAAEYIAFGALIFALFVVLRLLFKSGRKSDCPGKTVPIDPLRHQQKIASIEQVAGKVDDKMAKKLAEAIAFLPDMES